MDEKALARIEASAATPVTCMYCGGVGSTQGSSGEDRCAPCAGKGVRPRDPDVLDAVTTLRRYRAELDALRAAMGARYDR